MATLVEAQNGIFTRKAILTLASTRIVWGCGVPMATRSEQEEELRSFCERVLLEFQRQRDLVEVEVRAGEIVGFRCNEQEVIL